MCAEYLRLPNSFDSKDAILGGAKTIASVLGYVLCNEGVVEWRWARAVARWRVGVVVSRAKTCSFLRRLHRR